MKRLIDADKLIAEILKLRSESCISESDDYYEYAKSEIIDIIESLQQEQPEVDLEKFTEKVKTFQARYKHPESISVKGAMAFMARMFYQYPNVARLWYEQLPKATMD